MKFGERLASARKRKDLTQDQLAKLTGFREKDIQRWETGDYIPRAWKIPVLAEALSINPTDLFAAISEAPAAPAPQPRDDDLPSTSDIRRRRARGSKRGNGATGSTRRRP